MQVSAEELLEADQVRHPYRFLKAGEPFQSRRSSALAEQIDSALTFILSGRHIGYLPLHCAAPWETRGLLRALDPGLDFSVPFTLARHRAQAPGEAQQALPKTCGRPSPESFGGLCTEGLSTPAPFATLRA